MQYNNKRGNWTRLTAYSTEEVKLWNSSPHAALQRASENKISCADNIDFLQKLGKSIFSEDCFKVIVLNGFWGALNMHIDPFQSRHLATASESS